MSPVVLTLAEVTHGLVSLFYGLGKQTGNIGFLSQASLLVNSKGRSAVLKLTL